MSKNKKIFVGEVIREDEYEIVEPLGFSKKQSKNPLVFYGTHHFKMCNEARLLGVKKIDENIDKLFLCCHSDKKCHCKMIIYKDKSAKIIGQHLADIYHMLDVQSYKRFKIRDFIQNELLKDDTQTPTQIITKLIKSIKIDEFYPSKYYINQLIAKIKENKLGILPTSLEKLKKEELIEKFGNFILFDEEEIINGEVNRVICFASELQIEWMKTIKLTLLFDSTFYACPRLFRELSIGHFIKAGKAFPLFFAVLSQKNKTCYKILFENLKKLTGMSIEMMMCDYEMAVRSVVKTVFGENVLIKGCWFHYINSILRRVQKLQLQKMYENNPKINKLVRCFFSLAFIPVSEIEERVNDLLDEINKLEGELYSKMASFVVYFKRTWMSGKKYNKADWNQCTSIELRSNNWSESFNNMVSGRCHKNHPNIFVLIKILMDICEHLSFEYNDYLQNPINYIYTDSKISDYTVELLYTMSKKDSLYKDNQIQYLFVLSLIPIKLLLRMELRLLESNNDNYNKSRIEEITSMLEDETKISLFTEEKIEKNDQKKLNIITQYHIEKRKKEIKEQLSQGKKDNRRRRLLKNFLLNEFECTELREKLNDVDNPNDENKVVNEFHNDNEFDEEEEIINNEFDEEENNNNEFEGEYENDDLNAVYEEDTQNPISYISQQKSTMEFLPDKDINNESNNSGKTQKVLKKKKTNGYKPAKRKITVVKERKNKKSILSKLRKITSKK